MSTVIDMEGKRFGRWLVIQRHGRTKTAYWLCRCDCGTEKPVNGSTLRRGLSTSCGCFSAELAVSRNVRHGQSDIPEYSVWNGMKTRCLNENDKHFKDYGGRGINICDRWLGVDGFSNFVSDMGVRPSPEHSIERKDGNRGYEPSNCCWATSKEQTRNYRRNRLFSLNGETKCLKDWCDHFRKPYHRTVNRLRWGWTIEKALFDDRDGRSTKLERKRREKQRDQQHPLSEI